MSKKSKKRKRKLSSSSEEDEKESSGSKTREREPSKPLHHEGTVPQRTEKTSKDGLDEKSSCSSSSKSKKQRAGPSLVSAEQKEKRHGVLKKRRTEEAPRTGNDTNTSNTRQPSGTSSSSKDSSWQKRTELFSKMRQWKVNKAKKSFHLTSSVSSSKAVADVTTVPAIVTSKVSKNVTTNSGTVTSVSHGTTMSSSVQQQVQPVVFKIAKMVLPKPVDIPGENKDAYSTNRNLKHGTKLSYSGALVSNFKQETHSNLKHGTKLSDSGSLVSNFKQETHSSLKVTPSFSSEGQAKTQTSSNHLQATPHGVTEPWCDQMQVGEELHLASTEKILEQNIMASYGKPTCMDIDPPEEGAADTHCGQPSQQYLLVLDTNILISHLDDVKRILSHGLGALGSPAVLIPWVVLQELDSLKNSSEQSHKAIHAISYIHKSMRNRTSRLWCQSLQEASESNNGLEAKNNDDRVLLCCLQYQRLYPGRAIILCSNDKNLCNKAIASGVTPHGMRDLMAEAGRASRDLHPGMLPHIGPHVSSTMQSGSYTQVQPHGQERTSLSVEEKENTRLSRREDEERTKWNISCVSELENCLQVVLSDVLEEEMKSAYGELWPEIVYRKPPWTLEDILQCLKKHWIAVFGHVVPRRMLQNVLNLITFFCSDTTVDCSATSAALQEAKELVNAFRKRSALVPATVSTLDDIHNKLQLQRHYPACDVVMNVNDEDKQPTFAEVSHQEVWALFESIWSYVSQKSLEVFKALGFDPHTMRSGQPVGGPPPPQDALVCLHKLSSIVSQLLQAFSSVLSSASGLKEVQVLLGIIHSNKIINVDSRLTARHLRDCFLQQDYRERLRAGGNQLMELKEALDGCVGTTGQHMTFTTSLP